MENFKKMWEENHLQYMKNDIVYDDWLEKYIDILRKSSGEILELGCGLGNDVKFLIDNGISEVASDYTTVVLENLKNKFPTLKTELVDLTKKFPFKDSSFNVIIADLCLHYFDEKTTFAIMNEIKRVLKNNGYLFARVNSIKDVNHGAGQGKKLEENYYFVEGYNKRFFDDKDVDKFFSVIGNVKQSDEKMRRYKKEKETKEVFVQCKK